MKKLLILGLFICHLGLAERILVYSGESEGVGFQFFDFAEIKHKNYYGGHQLHSGFLLVKGIDGLEGHWGYTRYDKRKDSIHMRSHPRDTLEVTIRREGLIHTKIKYGKKTHNIPDCKAEDSGLRYTSYKSKYNDSVDLGQFIISNETKPMTIPTSIYILEGGEALGPDRRLVHGLREIGVPVGGTFPFGGVLYRADEKFQDRRGVLVLDAENKTFSFPGYDKKKKIFKLEKTAQRD